MKKMIHLAAGLLLGSMIAVAQPGEKAKEKLDNKSARDRERSMGGQRTDNELKDDRGEVKPTNHMQGAADGKNAADSSAARGKEDQSGQQVVSKNENQPQNLAKGNAEGGATVQAVVQSTSSESGSAAVLSKNNGKDRDGTNSVQRASPNMAGAKVSNMNLDRLTKNERSEKKDSMTTVQSKGKQPQQPKEQSHHDLAKGKKNGTAAARTSTKEKNRKQESSKNTSGKNSDKAKKKNKEKHAGK